MALRRAAGFAAAPASLLRTVDVVRGGTMTVDFNVRGNSGVCASQCYRCLGIKCYLSARNKPTPMRPEWTYRKWRPRRDTTGCTLDVR